MLLCCYTCRHFLIHVGVFLSWDNDLGGYSNAAEKQGKAERQGKKEARAVCIWEAYGFTTVIFLLDLFLCRVLQSFCFINESGFTRSLKGKIA